MEDTASTRQRNAIIVIALIALIVFGLTVLIIWRWKKSRPETEAEVKPVVSVKVAKAEKGSIASQVVAVGTIWPREKADVGAKVSAQIKKMALLKNKVVRAGEAQIVEVTDAQTTLVTQRSALYQAIYDYQIALSRLRQATGQ